MIDKAGEGFLEFLLEFYNKCWEKGEIPTNWYETLMSYIYKNKGRVQELTSYRPIALTSMIANLFKIVWLHRLVPMIDKHLSHCQGGFRVGSGVKEQLWALICWSLWRRVIQTRQRGYSALLMYTRHLAKYTGMEPYTYCMVYTYGSQGADATHA